MHIPKTYLVKVNGVLTSEQGTPTKKSKPADAGRSSKERGQSIAIAQSIMEMSRFPVPIVVVVTGEGGSGGAGQLGAVLLEERLEGLARVLRLTQ